MLKMKFFKFMHVEKRQQEGCNNAKIEIHKCQDTYGLNLDTTIQKSSTDLKLMSSLTLI